MAEDLPEDHRKDGRTAGRNNNNKSSTRRRRRERYYRRGKDLPVKKWKD
jgi:hypothetical protein